MIPSSCSRSCPSKLLPLLLKFFALAAFVAGMAVPTAAQDKIEIYPGYSYFRASIEEGQFGPLGPGTPCPPNCGTPPHVAQNANLNGGEFSAPYKYGPFFGGLIDFNGAYGRLHGAGTREHTYLIKPTGNLHLVF